MAKLTVIGSGGPIPNRDRFGTAHMVESGERRFLFDCGPGTTYKLGKLGVSALHFDHLFISHHHFDHTADLPAFLLTRWDHSIGTEEELSIFGPEGTGQLIDRLVGENGAYSTDWKARVNHPVSQRMHQLRGGSLPRPAPSFAVRDVSEGIVCKGDGFTVTAAPSEHVQPHLESVLYRLETNDISVVFTGDARPCDHFVRLASGADVLVSMCGNFQSELERKGVDEVQTGTLGAAEMAAEAGVGQLILVHMGPDISSESGRAQAKAEISNIYHGEVMVTDEMVTYDLKRGRLPVSTVGDESNHTHIARHSPRRQ